MNASGNEKAETWADMMPVVANTLGKDGRILFKSINQKEK